jgi:RecA/RadA recombinase
MAKEIDWFAELSKDDHAVVEYDNPFTKIIDSPSPSVNFIFGNSWGLPRGYTAAFFGPPKGGKTLLTNAIIGQTHRNDPTAWVVKYNSEEREKVQFPPKQQALYGVDRKRYMCYETNQPDHIFDHLETTMYERVQRGMNLHLVVIDSISGIKGRRAMNADSVMVTQIGDHALTIKDGMKRILDVQRKCNFALIVICQVGAELDQIEQMRGHKFKMNASFGLQHYAEYFICVEKNNTKEGRSDLLGNEFKNENATDMAGRAEQTAHKIKVTMRDSSIGPKGRVGQFTLDYHKGIVNVHEEVFQLACARGIIDRPNNTSYIYGDRKWVGKGAMLEALRMDTDLQKAIIKRMKELDLEGRLGADFSGETETTDVGDVFEIKSTEAA